MDVAQGDAGVEGGGDERVPQRVRADRLGDAGSFGHAADDASGAVPVQALAVGAEEDRPVKAFADREVEAAGGPWGERDGDDLATFAQDGEGAVAAFAAHGGDVRPEGFADPQAVEREQRYQRMVQRCPEAGGDEQGAELVAVQRGGVGFVVQPGPAHMRGRGVIEQLFLDAYR